MPHFPAGFQKIILGKEQEPPAKPRVQAGPSEINVQQMGLIWNKFGS